MHNLTILEPKIITSFQVAWESTLKCNLDCSYCGDGHDNKTNHPNLEECLNTIDFIVDYLDLYMKIKPIEQKHANLNIQGGESIFHPDILKILEYLENKRSKYNDWKLQVSFITNAVIGKKTWENIIKTIDYFTISFHAEMLEKQSQMWKENVLCLKSNNKNFHVAVLMHPRHWDKCLRIIEWCKENNIKFHQRQIDHHWADLRFNYNKEQAEFLTGKQIDNVGQKIIKIFKNGFDLSSLGRACCSGQCLIQNEQIETTYIKGNNFKEWYCSVNQFFLYIRQVTGEVFTNKDCKMNLEGEIAPIGYLNKSDNILEKLKNMIETNTLPVIRCKKSSCWCGLCAPKAKELQDFNRIIKKYHV
jgi:pyruvate-formate lyase-activating enzyme